MKCVLRTLHNIISPMYTYIIKTELSNESSSEFAQCIFIIKYIILNNCFKIYKALNYCTENKYKTILIVLKLIISSDTI